VRLPLALGEPGMEQAGLKCLLELVGVEETRRALADRGHQQLVEIPSSARIIDEILEKSQGLAGAPLHLLWMTQEPLRSAFDAGQGGTLKGGGARSELGHEHCRSEERRGAVLSGGILVQTECVPKGQEWMLVNPPARHLPEQG